MCSYSIRGTDFVSMIAPYIKLVAESHYIGLDSDYGLRENIAMLESMHDNVYIYIFIYSQDRPIASDSVIVCYCSRVIQSMCSVQVEALCMYIQHSHDRHSNTIPMHCSRR